MIKCQDKCQDSKGCGSSERGENNVDFNDTERGLGLECNGWWEERGIGCWAEGMASHEQRVYSRDSNCPDTKSTHAHFSSIASGIHLSFVYSLNPTPPTHIPKPHP